MHCPQWLQQLTASDLETRPAVSQLAAAASAAVCGVQKNACPFCLGLSATKHL